PPVRTSNFAPCKGQVTSWPEISPSAKEACSWVHMLSIAKNSPLMLNRAICLPLASTSRAGTGLISSVLATFTKWVILLASCLLLPTFRYGRSAPAIERREELRCGLVKACRCSFPIRQPNTPASVEESWELQSQDGDSIQLQIRMSVAK